MKNQTIRLNFVKSKNFGTEFSWLKGRIRQNASYAPVVISFSSARGQMMGQFESMHKLLAANRAALSRLDAAFEPLVSPQ